MDNVTDESWRVLLSLLPPDWVAEASRSGAVTRLRGFESTEAVLRTLLLHVGKGYSMRETSVQARLAGVADVSDVTVLNRLRQAEGWWHSLCQALLSEKGVAFPEVAPQHRVRVLDGTLVKEPGRTGSLWRIHYSLRLPSLLCDHLSVTSTRGQGTAEILHRFPAAAGDLVLADRGFCTPVGVEQLRRQKADILIRWRRTTLPLSTPDGRRFDFLTALRGLPPGQPSEWDITIRGPRQVIPGRICAIRKSAESTAKAQRKIRLKAQQGGPETKPETLELAAYVIVFTTVPKAELSTGQVLAWYRCRWEIGVSRQGHIVQPVRDRPRLKDSGLVAGEAPWRESKTAEPSGNMLGKEYAQRTRLQRAVNADVASLHEHPVAETVDNARKQQGLAETSPMRQLSPAGYQRRHGVKDDVETGEALAVPGGEIPSRRCRL